MVLLLALYGCVIFLSAFLLFMVQPMVAKQLLPVVGGSAAVWTTCLVFFQSALLAGYSYAHRVVGRLRPRAQAITHIGLLTAALLALGVHAHPNAWPVTWYPILSILLLLTAIIGLPYLALAATTPLLQSWLARTLGLTPAGKAPPYRLFALSNAGSLLALLAYPTLVEPHISLRAQADWWSKGFFLFAVLCGAIAWQSRRSPASPLAGPDANASPDSRPGLRHKALIAALPACGSMLLCAFTNHLSENIAAIPLLWILPLTAYLLSFIVAFAGPRWYPRSIMHKLLAFSMGVVCYIVYDVRTALPIQISVPVFCIALFISCLFCHGELYRLRPASGDTTSFYLLLSAGSALGSVLVGIVAPNVFPADYELIGAVALTAALAAAITWQQGITPRLLWSAVTAVVLVVAGIQARELHRDTLIQVRSFYGSLRVTETHIPPEAGVTRTLFHGTIQHGTQLYGGGLRNTPTTYYAPDSGIGLALRFCCGTDARRVAIVGLGAGTLAAYGRPGDQFTFFELNPLVERLAQSLFTYMRESQAAVHIVLGDARLSLAHDSGPPNDIVVLDAFSGDAVPVHLLTAQAVALYLRHLKPGGILAFHISSQYLDLAPVLAEQARHAGLQAFLVRSAENEPRGEFSADWVLMSSSGAFFSRPEVHPVLRSLPERPGLPFWTDDFNSLLPLLKWQGMPRH